MAVITVVMMVWIIGMFWLMISTIWVITGITNARTCVAAPMTAATIWPTTAAMGARTVARFWSRMRICCMSGMMSGPSVFAMFWSAATMGWMAGMRMVMTVVPSIEKAFVMALTSMGGIMFERASSTVLANVVTSVAAGISFEPKFATLVAMASCDWLYAIRSELASWYFWPASPYSAFMAETTSCWRSCSEVQAASASLNASSFVMPWSSADWNAAWAAVFPPIAAVHWSALALTQLRASAKLPVTVPAFTVSLAASARASMGMPSPNWL